MNKLQAVTDGVVIFTIIWALGSFIKAFVYAYQWIKCF